MPFHDVQLLCSTLLLYLLICHNIDTTFLQNFCRLNFLHASYLLPFKNKTVDSRKLHTKLWFVYRRTTNMGGNSIHSMTTLLQLTTKAHERAQFFRHDVIAWLPPFCITFSIRSSVTFGGNTWGKITYFSDLLWI